MANPTSFRALGATTMLAPVPAVLVSCRGTQPPYDRDNLITVAWAGTVCSDPPMLSISVRKSRFSHAQLMQSGCFYVNLVSQELCRATDFCGVRSGRDVDKFAACGLTPVRLDALPETPAVAQAPICLACRVQSVQELGSHDLFLARILQVYVQERLFGEKGEIVMERARLCAYSHGEYRALGRMLGFFGYSIASPEALARRMPDRSHKER